MIFECSIIYITKNEDFYAKILILLIEFVFTTYYWHPIWYCTVLIDIVDDELFVKDIVAIDDDPKLIPIGGSAADETVF